MKTKSTLMTMCAVVLIALATTACAEQRAQSSDPNAFAKESYSYSYPNNNESTPQEQTAELGINGEVMSAVGKTVDELSERYGAAREGLSDVYLFDNGLGWYNCGNNGSCQSVHGVKPADFLVGDLSTVTLDNLAEKCGFNVVPLNEPEGEFGTMYEGYRMAYYTHPDYPNTSFELFYNEEGFDETAEFSVRFNSAASTDDLIVTLNSVIDTAADVETLNSGIRSADTDARVAEVRAFENPTAFETNTLYSDGELKDGAIVLVELSDGRRYITSRGERTTEPVPVPMMFSHIVLRADSVEQLKDELDGYNLGLGDKKATNVTLYQDGEAADAGDDSGERIIQNGNLVASDSTLKKGGVVRVEYDGGKSWVCFALNA